MGTTQIVISFGEGNLYRLGLLRTKRGYPLDKTNDAFVRELVMGILEKEVPE